MKIIQYQVNPRDWGLGERELGLVEGLGLSLSLRLGQGQGSYTMNSTDTRPQLREHNKEIVALYLVKCPEKTFCMVLVVLALWGFVVFLTVD